MKKKKFSATKLVTRLQKEHPYIVSWAEQYLPPKRNPLLYNRDISIIVLNKIVLGNKKYNVNGMFHHMGIKKGKWPELYYKTYEWILENEALVQLRLL